MNVPKRIMVIESPPEVLVQLLRTTGYLAVGATNVEDGFTLYAKVQRSIDVAILDDKVDREGVLLRKFLEERPTLKIIYLASAEPESLPANVTVLNKPVSPMRLAAAIG